LKKKLTRSNNRLIAGVCGGIAQYLGVSAKAVRVAYLVFFLICSFFGLSSTIPIVLYVVLMVALPPAPGPSYYDLFSLFGNSKSYTQKQHTSDHKRKVITDVKEKDISDK
jgi:phage shock protein C